jgi:hypothetical protein
MGLQRGLLRVACHDQRAGAQPVPSFPVWPLGKRRMKYRGEGVLMSSAPGRGVAQAEATAVATQQASIFARYCF